MTWYQYHRDRLNRRREGRQLIEYMKKVRDGTMLLQRVYRGYQGREFQRRKLILLAVQHKAAIMIQRFVHPLIVKQQVTYVTRVYRGSLVLHWKDIKLNVIAAFVLDRHYVDRREIVIATRKRYKLYVDANRGIYPSSLENNNDIQSCVGDSGSEPDDDEIIEWYSAFDRDRKRPYWYNKVNKEILFDEPRTSFAHENSLIGRRVKIFWVVQVNLIIGYFIHH